MTIAKPNPDTAKSSLRNVSSGSQADKPTPDRSAASRKPRPIEEVFSSPNNYPTSVEIAPLEVAGVNFEPAPDQSANRNWMQPFTKRSKFDRTPIRTTTPKKPSKSGGGKPMRVRGQD